MSDVFYSVFITGFFMITASVIGGYFTLIASNNKRKLNSYKNRLRLAYQDIAAFYRLEERYTSKLADDNKTANAWKRDIRKNLRQEGFHSPSDDATAQSAEQNLKELGEN